MVRMMMLHAGIHWPEQADPSLWPMAVQQAVFLYNHVPCKDTSLSSYEMFTKICWPSKHLHDLHVWGCPLYVLQSKLGNGQKIP